MMGGPSPRKRSARPSPPRPAREPEPTRPPEIDPERPPTTPAELSAWLRDHLDIAVPARALLEGHHGPLEYLAAAFLGDAPGDDAPDLVVWAGRGGGKTFLSALATALDLVFKPGIQIRVLAGSVEQGRRTHAHLRALFERPPLSALVEGRITERRLRLANGSCVEVLAPSQASVRGVRVQKIRCDEVDLFDPEVWDAAQLATRSAELPWGAGRRVVRGTVEAISTLHVPHGLMGRIVGEAHRGHRRLFKWGVVDVLEDCPPARACGSCALHPACQGRAKGRPGGVGGHLRIDDALAMQRRVSQAQWDAEMLCLRPTRTDAVYPEFKPAEHVTDEEPEGGALLAGMDFGLRGETAVLWAVHDAGGRLVVVGERLERERAMAEHVAAMLASPRGRPLFTAIDPAGLQRSIMTADSPARALRDAGLAPRWSRLRLREGVALVRARLRPADGGGPRLLVHRRCVRLIEALSSYHYDARRPESGEPVKDGPDHACDALRYLVTAIDRGARCELGKY